MTVTLSSEVKRIFSELEKFNRGNPLRFDDQIYFLRKKFTERREQLLSGYMNHPDQFAAYSSFHFPVHLPETFWILDQLFQKQEFKAPKKILDLGCGPGTTSLAAHLWFLHKKKQVAAEWTFVDQSKRALDCAKALHPGPTKIIRSNIIGLKKNAANQNQDWIFLSHVLNEMGSGPRSRDQKMRFLDHILGFLAPGGLLFVIEPPLKEPTFDLMWIRDQAAQSEEITVLAPCPKPQALCPMILGKMGWCYAQPPRIWAKALGLCPWDYMIKKVGKIALQDPGFSYMVFQKTPSLEPTKNSRIALSDTLGRQGWICQGDKVSRGSVPFRGAYLEFDNTMPEKLEAKTPEKAAPLKPWEFKRHRRS